MKKLLAPLFLIWLTLQVGCVVADGPDASLTIYNDSSYVLEEIRIANVGDRSWGPNLVRGTLLYPDEAIEVFVDCGFYDALVVDELGAECILTDLDLCFSASTWSITDQTLLRCDF